MDAQNGQNLRSFVDAANAADCPFPIQNLPFGIFSTASNPRPRAGVAIGDRILDLAAVEAAHLLPLGQGVAVFDKPTLNAFMALGPAVWTATRARIGSLLDAENAELRDNTPLRARALAPLHSAALHMPIAVSGFTDFYSSKEHASNAGRMFRGPQNPLPSNWCHIPIAYNGRASSVIVSGTPVRRPLGQTKPSPDAPPVFGPCGKLDFELEVGTVIGQPSELGQPLSAAQAAERIFGYVLLNDWSARDIQSWETVPLGPFQAKIFATSISPWVIMRAALAPFQVPGPEQDPEPLPYLREAGPRNFDLHLEAALKPRGASQPVRVCRTNFKHMYWSSVQQAVHHAAGGCNLQTGDLLGSGTVSGPERSSCGSLLELTWNGTDPLNLGAGIERRFLEDGDTVIMTGWCQGDGYRIGFGEVSAEVLPSLDVKT
jgi:fumarylacetoacetase